MCLRRLKASRGQREETTKLKKRKLISGKRFAGVRSMPSIVGLVVLVSIVMTAGVALVSGGYLLRAIRRKSRKEETPLDWYTLRDGRTSTPSQAHPQRRL